MAFYFTHFPPQDMLQLGLGLGAGALGGLLPDIDHSGSKITKNAGIIGTIISKCLKHRGISHTPLLWTLIFGLLYYYFPTYHFLWIPCVLGCFSHIFLDSLTPAGVPIFFPFTKAKINLLGIKTGGKIEFLISLLLQMGCLLLLVDLVQNNFN